MNFNSNNRGNPNHDEMGRFTSGSNNSRKSGTEEKMVQMGFGPSSDFKERDDVLEKVRDMGYNDPFVYHPYHKIKEKKWKERFKGKENPENLTSEDFRAINSSHRYGLENALQKLQENFWAWGNAGGGAGPESIAYWDAYNKFWEKYGPYYKGTVGAGKLKDSSLHVLEYPTFKIPGR